ncbi:MAG: AraC family transcriptional regulator [Robiginitomaculum sp.]|nr:MAG: AraC family transcriptional regulator [Robiginitomaculum sp.]
MSGGNIPSAMVENKKVCIIAYDGLCTLEYSIAIEIFALPRPEYTPWYDCQIVAADNKPIRGLGNIFIDAEKNLEQLSDADLIIIPGWRGVDRFVPPDLKQALLKANQRGARIASICLGVFVLAACGLLDKHKVATHWKFVDALRERFPDVFVDPNVLYIDSGDILTSAGSAAGIDLCLHIVRTDFGVERANEVARRLVVPAYKDDGQSQFIVRSVGREYKGNVAKLMDVIREELGQDWNIGRMADVCNTSPRTLQRKFRDATGLSPHAWITRERVELVKELLETTDLNIEQIAGVAGLKTPETLRHHFKRVTGTCPTKFRSKFNPDGRAWVQKHHRV